MFSRFKKATSQNIVYTGPNQAIGPNAISLPANNDKFLKNVNNTLSYVSLPLPDPNTQTADKDNYTVVFDYTNKLFKLVYIKIPYNALVDSKVIYTFFPTTANTTFTGSNLTKITNLSTTGTTYDITTGTTIVNPANFTLDNGQGLKITPSSPAFFLMPNSFYHSNNNFAYVFAFKYNNSYPGNYLLIRSSTTNTVNSSGTTGSYPYATLSYNNSTTATPIYGYAPSLNIQQSSTFNNNSNNILVFGCIGGTSFMRLNGVNIASTATQSSLPTGSMYLSLLNGTNSSGLDANNNFYGTIYNYALLQNLNTMLDLQRYEGYIVWSSLMNNIVFTLDATHPFKTQAPSIN